MRLQATSGQVPVEITFQSESGLLTLDGRITGLRQRKAEVVLADVEAPSAGSAGLGSRDDRAGRQDAQVAVVVKDSSGRVLDIVPSRVREIQDSQGAGPMRLLVEFVRRPTVHRERRAARRSPCDIPVAFVPVSYENRRLSAKRSARGRLYDISTHGARLGTTLKLPKGLFVEIRYTTANKQGNVVARIVNRQSLDGTHLYGLRFVTDYGGSAGRSPARSADG